MRQDTLFKIREAKVILVGLNHRTARVEVRERLAFGESQLPGALAELAALACIEEAMVVSTCNRVEIIANVSDLCQGLRSLESFLQIKGRMARGTLGPMLYRYTGKAAVRHLFRVASSLDSMIVGEPQILGQVKRSYTIATQAGTAGTALNILLQASFRVAKRARAQTGIGRYPVSAGSAAVELAHRTLGTLHGKSILVIGAGKMCEAVIRHLASSGTSCIRVANRSSEAAVELAARIKGTAVPFGQLARWIAESDIVIASTGAPDPLVDRGMVESAMRARPRVPLVFVDISVPRNVDPAVSMVDNVLHYDVDDLGAVVQANLQERSRAAIHAEKLVEQEVERVYGRLLGAALKTAGGALAGAVPSPLQAEASPSISR